MASERPRAQSRWVREHSVVTFYALAFAISWLGFVPVLAGSRGVQFFRSPLWKLGLALPGCGPALAVAITLRLCGARGNPLARLRAALRWRMSAWWYAVAVLLPAALIVTSQGVIGFGKMGQSGLLGLTLMSLAANPWEEVGWRGFALTRLEERHSGLWSALVTGVLWGLWHIPLFLWPESPMSSYSFPVWFGGVLGRACIISWIYNRTGQSLAVAIVFHLASNLWAGVIGVESELRLAAVDVAVACGLVWFYGRELSRPQPTTT